MDENINYNNSQLLEYSFFKLNVDPNLFEKLEKKLHIITSIITHIFIFQLLRTYPCAQTTAKVS